MTILNPKPIIDKLEKDGVETVKAKKAKNLYRLDKLKLVNEWLAEKAQETEVDVVGEAPDEIKDKDPDETKGKDSGSGQWTDAETLELANKTDEEYNASDSNTKRAITRARKKLTAIKE